MADPAYVQTCYRHPREVTGVRCTRCGRPICPECMHPAPVGHHCPACIAEARREARVPLSSRARGSVVRLGRPGGLTTLLLAANLTVFAAEVALGLAAALGGRVGLSTLVRLGGIAPVLVAQGQYWRFLTAMFLHAGLLHLAFNGWALYLFGNLVERAYGRARFLAVYFVSGFLGGVTSYVFSPPQVVAVGASGAIFGLLGAWLVYNWRRRELATASANLRWVAMILLINVVLGLSLPGIDNFAHAGGFVAGMAGGALAEGVGLARTRAALAVAGFLGLLAVGVGLVVVRTAALTA